MKEYIKNTNLRRRIYIFLLLLIIIIPPLAFYVFTVSETLSLKNLDRESYDSRMGDSFLFAVIMFVCFLFFVVPLIIITNNMFKRYFGFIKTLSADDTKKMISLNEKENFFYQYTPSYILRDHTVTFFTMFRENSINFNDIISIDVRQIFHKGYRAIIRIETRHSKYQYTLYGNPLKVTNLITEALTANPKIINNKNWNY